MVLQSKEERLIYKIKYSELNEKLNNIIHLVENAKWIIVIEWILCCVEE